MGKVPKGATFLIIMYKLHRLESVWGPDADKFRPENFTPENVAKRPAFSFIPFGAGGRICIGESLKISFKSVVHIKTIFQSNRNAIREFKYSYDAN